MRNLLLICWCLLTGAMAQAADPSPVRIYAAASLTNVLNDIAGQWAAAQGQPAPVGVYGASSAMARQVIAGAPADLFASADSRWMDELQAGGVLEDGSRVDLLGNALVLIAPLGKPLKTGVTFDSSFDLAGAFEGRWCTGEPGVVPVGSYAREALEHFGWWAALAPRIVGTEDVRGALAFVERGECALGIVYATDARISQKVQVLATFPAGSHAPIVYPVALLKTATTQARSFYTYLLAAPQARATFQQQGFTLLRP